MAIETADYITELVSSNPTGLDDRSTADNHIRLIKHVLKSTFPNLAGAVLANQTQLNALIGQSGDVSTELSGIAGDITDLLARTGSLEASVSAMNTVVATLQVDVNANTGIITDLSADVTNLQSSLSGIDTRIDDLSASLSAKIPQGAVYGGRVDFTGSSVTLPDGWSSILLTSGQYQVNHSLGITTSDVAIICTPYLIGATAVVANVVTIGTNSFTVNLKQGSDDVLRNTAFSFMLMRLS